MAVKKRRIKGKREKHMPIRRLLAAVSLISFFVIIIAHLRSGLYDHSVSFEYLFELTAWATFRAFLVLFAIGICSRIILKILNTYEETGSG